MSRSGLTCRGNSFPRRRDYDSRREPIMEGLITCGFLAMLAVVLVPIVQLLKQRAKLRSLQSTVDKITQRVAGLEARGVAAPVAPSVATEAAAPAERREPAPPPIAVPPPLPTTTIMPAAIHSSVATAMEATS